MITCDRCLNRNIDRMAVVFKRFDGTNKQGRTMLNVQLDLCDQCITDLLKAFGYFKVEFMKEGDEPEVPKDMAAKTDPLSKCCKTCGFEFKSCTCLAKILRNDEDEVSCNDNSAGNNSGPGDDLRPKRNKR